MSKNDDITLAPRNRNKLMDDEYKLGKIDITREEKVILAKLVASPEWSILKNIYLKQRAVQIATTSINFAKTLDDVSFYRGCAAENKYISDDIERIVRDFTLDEEKKAKKKAEKTAPKPAGPTDNRVLVSKVK